MGRIRINAAPAKRGKVVFEHTERHAISHEQTLLMPAKRTRMTWKCPKPVSPIWDGCLRGPQSIADDPLGTNTYLLGWDIAVDPGPMDLNHLSALIAAINGRTVSHIRNLQPS
jgi:hypothetical protein